MAGGGEGEVSLFFVLTSNNTQQRKLLKQSYVTSVFFFHFNQQTKVDSSLYMCPVIKQTVILFAVVILNCHHDNKEI